MANAVVGPPKPEAKPLGLQEERIHRDAWKAVVDALEKLKALRDAEGQQLRYPEVDEVDGWRG